MCWFSDVFSEAKRREVSVFDRVRGVPKNLRILKILSAMRILSAMKNLSAMKIPRF